MMADPQTQQQAAEWLVRRDRGLTAAEQDLYLQWLRESPLHPAALAHQEAALRRLCRWQELSAGGPLQPEAGHFAPTPAAPGQRRGPAWAIAAALIALIAWQRFPRPEAASSPRAAGECRKVNVRQTLADGTVVELKDGSEIEVDFTAGRRRVVLQRGEAYFTVVHNAARPFVVEAGSVVVRDVGTVFDVRRDLQSVQVLVTEGRVSLNRPQTPEVAAGQRAVVALAGDAPAVIEPLAPAERADALAWQKPRFEFSSTPLPVAVEEFNRTRPEAGPKLVIGDPSLLAVKIGGTLRADDVEGFVRLLSLTVGLRADRRAAGEIVLRPAP